MPGRSQNGPNVSLAGLRGPNRAARLSALEANISQLCLAEPVLVTATGPEAEPEPPRPRVHMDDIEGMIDGLFERVVNAVPETVRLTEGSTPPVLWKNQENITWVRMALP